MKSTRSSYYRNYRPFLVSILLLVPSPNAKLNSYLFCWRSVIPLHLTSSERSAQCPGYQIHVQRNTHILISPRHCSPRQPSFRPNSIRITISIQRWLTNAESHCNHDSPIVLSFATLANSVWFFFIILFLFFCWPFTSPLLPLSKRQSVAMGTFGGWVVGSTANLLNYVLFLSLAKIKTEQHQCQWHFINFNNF